MNKRTTIKQGNGPVIGVSIGSGSIKLVQFVKDRDGLRLLHTAHTEMDDKPGTDPSHDVLLGLKEVFKNVALQNAQVVCVVNCPRTLVAKIRLPVMPDEELEQAVRWQAKNHFPFPLEAAVLDYKVIDKSLDGDNVKLNVIVATTTRENIQPVIEFFNTPSSGQEQAGRLSAIIPTSIALENIFVHSAGVPSEAFAVVEMERTLTEFNVYKNGRLEFSRKLPLSGNDITQSITRPLITPNGKVEFTHKEAEQIQIKYGVPEAGQKDMVEGKITSTQLLSLMRPKLELLVNEIDRSVEFYQGEHGETINKIILQGGQARIKGLEQYLSKELNFELKTGDIVNGVDALSGLADEVKQNPSHRLDLAVGAALHDPQGINLSPKKKQSRAAPKSLTKGLVPAAGAAVVLVLLGVLFMNVSLRLQKSKKHYEMSVKEYRDLTPGMKALRDKLQLSQFLKQRPQWGGFFKELSRQVLPNIYLSQMSMQDDRVKLAGMILPVQGQDNEAALAEFMQNLNGGACIHVGLIEAKKDPADTRMSQFEIMCQVTQDVPK